MMVDGYVLVPVELFDALGFLVTWQPKTQQVRLEGATVITIPLNGDVFTTDNTMMIFTAYDEVISTGEKFSHTLDVPAQAIDGITMMPIAILERVGYDVNWDEATQTVIITSSN